VVRTRSPGSKEATGKTFHHDDLESLKTHVFTVVTAYNFAKDLKALKWETPFQSICDAWKSNPSAFKIDPHHLIPGPHTWATRSYQTGSTKIWRGA
jgi:hypothetical protein